MTALILALAGTAATFLIGLLTVWLNDRASMRTLVTQNNQTIVDNLQEERSDIKSDLNHVKRQVSALLMESRYKDDYINVLRDHIQTEKGPPPPAYPVALLRIASEGL